MREASECDTEVGRQVQRENLLNKERTKRGEERRGETRESVRSFTFCRFCSLSPGHTPTTGPLGGQHSQRHCANMPPDRHLILIQ